jgi:transposase InsO family protein
MDAHQYGIEHFLIQPGKSTHNAYIELFNGKFRDECLNEHWFESLSQAMYEIVRWRTDFNEVRPHSSSQSRRNTRIQASQFTPCLLRRKSPIDGCRLGVAR